jgi:hypothetical protein
MGENPLSLSQQDKLPSLDSATTQRENLLGSREDPTLELACKSHRFLRGELDFEATICITGISTKSGIC